jgi:hypothetical protein
MQLKGEYKRMERIMMPHTGGNISGWLLELSLSS